MTRRPGTLAAACGAWLALSGCRCGKAGLEPAAPPPAAVADHPAVLATIPDGAPAIEREFHFAEHGGGVAWIEVQGGSLQVVHNGRAGKAYVAVAELALSPDGRRCAHAAKVGEGWRLVVDGSEGQGFDELLAPVFSPDGRHLAYQARAGSRWHLVVDGAMSEGSASPLLGLQFSGDSTRIAFIDGGDGQGSGRLVVSDLAFKAPVVVDGKASVLRVNGDRTRAAFASASGGQAQVVGFAFERPGEARRGPEFEAVSMLTFGPDGRSLAYLGERGVQTFMVLDDREEALPQGQYFGPPAIRPDGKAVGIFVLTGDEVRLHQAFAEGGPREVVPGEGDGLVYSAAGVPAYATSRGEKHYLVVGGKEGPPFDRVVDPAFSPDGKLVVYRARKDGKRFVVVADLDGKTIRQHPPYEQVFRVRFTAGGRSVAYGVKDGPRLEWKVEPL
jgi:hypothetical protein